MIAVPQGFREMPRWWGDEHGRAWLQELPALVDQQCARWDLVVDGPPLHGSNALVVPVRRGEALSALRMGPPGDDVARESQALRVWDGRGTVRLLDADEPRRALLLERLDSTRTLQAEPLEVAVPVVAELTRALAVPVAAEVPSTSGIAAGHVEGFGRDWSVLGQPTPRSQLERATALAGELAAEPSWSLAVDGDLHCAQVLGASRAPWLVVDPVLLRGDPEYDLARVLWSRLDELPGDADVVRAFTTFTRVAEVPVDRARAWVVVRSMSYLLWGLTRGLTDDPPRCRRLLGLFC